MADSFSTYHPAVNFLYFTLVLLCSMFLMHPLCLAVSLGSAVAYALCLGGRKALRFQLRFLLPLLLLTALLNPAFNHQGATILLYLPSGNPLTAESIFYGLASAAMMAAVLCWFRCFNTVMTSDKFIYLFGRVIPALSLLLSMTLRFVPRFRAQLKTVSDAQRCVGRDVSGASLKKRLHNALTVFSILVTWAMENAIETADSMKSRGYGLPGRSAFSIYRFDRRDRQMLCYLLGCGALTLAAWWGGAFSWRYYPTLQGGLWTAGALGGAAAYLALCLAPLGADWLAARRWAAREKETCVSLQQASAPALRQLRHESREEKR